jgi:HTH-type transcriptional regulator / antitoxin HipB
MKQSARTAKQLGAIIRRERRNRGFSQTELGKKIGLRQATISKLEAGKPATQLRTLLDVLAAMGLEIIIDERGKASSNDIESLF